MSMTLLAQFWTWLVSVHPSIIDVKQRQQSRLLASLMIAVISTSAVAMVIFGIVRGRLFPEELTYVFPAQLCTLALYVINRQGYYQASTALFMVLNAILIHITPVLTGDVAWYMFVPMLVTFGAIFMSFEFTVALLVSSLFLQGISGAIDYSTTEFGQASSIVITLVNSTVILIFLAHRRRLEQDRRADLERLNQQLRQSEMQLEQRVIERTNELAIATQEAQAARAAAEEANSIKSQFLANMSHELRTPLNAILNFTGFVADGVMGPINDQQEHALQQALSSSQHLLALINDILDITKIEAQMMDLFIQEVNMNEVLEASISTGKVLAKGKPLTIHSTIDNNLPLTFGDKRRLRQVMLNIISNAVKFTPEGSVTIRAAHDDKRIKIAVQDTGIGIAPEDQSLVFESFRQGKYQPTETMGTGLGMPISKYFVESHGGQIWLDSEMGTGTTVFVELPILTKAEAESRANLHPELA